MIQRQTYFVVQVENEASEQRRYKSKHIVLGCGAGPKSTSKRRNAARVVDVSALLGFEFPELYSAFSS